MDLLNKHEDQQGSGLSYDLWKNFPVHEILALRDRNAGWGFFDDFDVFSPTTLVGGYTILAGTGCSVAQIACEADAKGIVRLALDGNAANDEAVLCRGGGLGAPFKIAGGDVCGEWRIRASSIAAAKHAWFAGLSEAAAGTTDHLFVDTTGAVADYNHLGFFHLAAQAGDVDGGYKADGQTAQNGTTQTRLDSLKTLVAATWAKLGFRYKVATNTFHWYVDGAEVTAAKLTSAQLAAVLFPDDVFLNFVIGAKDIGGDTALNLDIDWAAVAQAA